jgi:hypothetical protein
MDANLATSLARFAWDVLKATKIEGVKSPADLREAAESVVRLFGDESIDPSLDGLGEKEFSALRICLELDPADAATLNGAVQSLARAFEPYIKRLLARVDESAFARYQSDKRTFTLEKALVRLQLGLEGKVEPDDIDRHDSPEREIDWAYTARNDCAHGAPKWDRRDRDRRRDALIAAFVLAAHKHLASLETAHAAVDWSALTRRILDQRGSDRIRSGFVTLIAAEQALDPIEPTASETAWEDPFHLTPASDDPRGESDEDDESNDDLDDDDLLFQQRRGKVAQLISEVGRFILVGRPGAGKTTSLRIVEWQLAADLHEGTQPLAPILVELKRCRPSAGEGVLQLAAKLAGTRDIRPVLADGEVVLLLDGVNEVAESEFDAAQIEIDEILCTYPDLPVVITSRPGWHRNQAGLPVFALDPLDDARIEEFLHKNMRPDIVPRFLDDLRAFPKLWTLARNPLTLAMLTRVGEETGGMVPENRAVVLRLFFEWMADREARKASQLDRNVKCILLARLAWEMRTAGVMTFSTERALRILAAARTELALSVSGDDFLDEVADNGFIQHANDEVAFDHELFLEYFAATELARQAEKDPELAARLSEEPRWREPVLLAYGLAAPNSAIRAQISTGRASVAADALMEQRDTTSEEQAAMAQAICRRTDDKTGSADILLGLITLENGESLFQWLSEDLDRVALIPRLDTSSLDLMTLIRATLNTWVTETRRHPLGTEAMKDSRGRRIAPSHRPSQQMRVLLRSHPSRLTPEQQSLIEKLAVQTDLPGKHKTRMLCELSAFAPSFFLQDDLLLPKSKHILPPKNSKTGNYVSLAYATRSLMLAGQIWRAIPSYLDLVTGEARGSSIDLFGPPATAGRDWMRLIRMGAVGELDTLKLISWVERSIPKPIPVDQILKELRPDQSSLRVMFAEQAPFVLARCTAVLLSLVPSEPTAADLKIPDDVPRQMRYAGRSPKKICYAACAYLRSLAEDAGSDGAAVHRVVVRLLEFVKEQMPETFAEAAVFACRAHGRLPAEQTRVSMRVPTTQSEAEVFDQTYQGRRFTFTVIPAKTSVRYRFLRFDGGGSQTAFYWPPPKVDHGALNGGERVTAEIRSTWVKKKETWGIKAIDVRLEN